MIGLSTFGSRLLAGSRRAIAPAAVLLALLAADGAGWLASTDRWLSDMRALPVRHAPGGDIVLVDIDPQSLAEIGVWPWPRTIHARLLERTTALGARRVAFDIDFSARTGAGDDAAFAEALRQSGAETFLAAFVQAPSTDPLGVAVSLPIDPLLEASWPAGVNLPLDPDGRARLFASRVETGSETIVSMPSLLAGREIEADLIGINHSIDADALPRISYVDVLNGRVDAARIAGKTLIVGATALELRDLFHVPVHGVVSGSTVIALATETLLQHRELRAVAVPSVVLLLLLGAHLAFSRPGRLAPHVGALLALMVAVEIVALLLHHRAGIMLRTATLDIALGAFAMLLLLSEFGLRKLLAAVSMAEAGNSRRLLDRVVETGFDGIVIVDAKDRIVRTNPAARRMPLWTAASAPSKALDDLPVAVATIVRDIRTAGGPTDRASQTFDISIETGTPDGVRETILELCVAPLEMIAVVGASGAPSPADHVCLTFRDVTAARRSHAALEIFALQDSLTGLANRRALEMGLADVHGAADPSCALMIFDLDRFKSVNDTLGHSVGDEVLVEVGRRARSTLGAAGTVARMGGDEFAALLPGVDLTTAGDRARALADAISQPFLVKGHRVSVGTSVGIAMSGSGAWAIDRLVWQADLALNIAKEGAGGARVVVFHPQMEDTRLARLELEADLSRAFDEQQFELAYQPQVAVPDGTIIGAEALIRWRHPKKGFISPALFIPVAEEMGLIHQLGEWVMKTACRDAAHWPSPISVAVNVSSIQFDAGDLVDVVERALETSGLSPHLLEIEITESAFVRESDHLNDTFAALQARGIRFALDDFGTGYSSLGYLHRFPIGKIKIDRQFVSGLPEDLSSMAIVRSIMALSHGLSIRTIAEGVETAPQTECLRILGCREIQGYAFYRPMTNADLRTALLDQIEKGADALKSA